MELLLMDTLYKGHNRNILHIKNRVPNVDHHI